MSTAIPTGGGGPGPPLTSYADKAKMNIRFDQRLKRNVLDIEVEKTDVREEMFLDQNVVAKLLNNLGMDINTEVEGYQPVYAGKGGKIAVLCREGVDLERFCRQESFEVCKGVTTKTIRPSGRKDVTLTVSGLDFNTPDSLVQEYIAKFGGILVSKQVIYARHGDGPFKGKLNGDRKYQVDMSSTTQCMGTYHYLDGERVRVYYRGNTKTCGRCHSVPQHCPGGGIARECQSEGGQRKDLMEHMKQIWSVIGFSPTTFVLPEREEDAEMQEENFGGDQKVLNLPFFPRQGPQVDISDIDMDKFCKTKVTNLPKDISVSETLEFLNANVDSSIRVTDFEIIRNDINSQIILGPGPSKEVVTKSVTTLDFHKSQKYFFQERKLYAKLLKPLSPQKNQKQSDCQLVDNKVKSVVDNLEAKSDKKNAIKPPTPSSQATKASASTPPVVRHKQVLASRGNKK